MLFIKLGIIKIYNIGEDKALKIKVFEVLSDMNIGGAGRLLLTRFALSDCEKFDQKILLPKGSELEKEFEKIGYSPIQMSGCMDRSFDIRGIIYLYKYFKRKRPDIVNSHGCISARIASAFAGVPVRIYTRHCAYEPRAMFTRLPFKNLIKMFTKGTTHKIIAVADAAKQNLVDVGIDVELIEVIINGVVAVEKYDREKKLAIRRELGIPEDAFVCGICARLEECKGIDILLRAARMLSRSNKDYYFMIVGKGSLSIELKELSNALGISDRVKFCGFASDITPYVNCFDLNINCSRGTETSSLSLSEGMSIGLPCIASDWGGNPYMVKDGNNGFVYPTDDFFALAKRISQLHDDKSLYDKMSENAYKRFCDELTAERMTRKTEALYEELFLLSDQSRTADAIAK